MAPEIIIYCLIASAGTAYVILGGADFGTGIWEFNNAFEVSDEERELSTRAMGPVWEANHVWLIFLLTLMFTCFPMAFSAMTQALWLPLFLAALGIVCRGTSFILRAYSDVARQQRLGNAVCMFFNLCSSFSRTAVGTVASGSLQFTAEGSFSGSYLQGWLTPLGIFSGFFSVGLSAYLAAVYLARDASREGEVELTELWRRRGLASGKWCGIFAFAGLAMMASSSAALWHGFKDSAVLCYFSSVGGLGSYVAMHNRQFTIAAMAAVLAVASVVLGLAWAMYPWILPPAFSVTNAMAPPIVIWLVIYVVIAGATVLLPSLWYLLYVFKLSKDSEHRHRVGH